MISLLLKETKKGRDVEFVISERDVYVKRLSDEVEFHTKLSPTEIAAYLLSCLADRAESKLMDKNARYVYHGKEQEALFLIRPTAKGRGVDGEFGFRAVPAIISCQNYDTVNTIAFDTVITAMDIFFIIGKVKEMVRFDRVIIGGSVFVTNQQGLFIRCGGSEVAEITEDARRLFVHRLARWLSGQFLSENNQERRYSPSFFNMNGVMFTGRKDARLRVHGITATLSYMDVAELYFVLSNAKAREGEAKNLKKEAGEKEIETATPEEEAKKDESNKLELEF